MIAGPLQLRHIGKEFLPELQVQYNAALNAYNERIADSRTLFDNKKLDYEQSLKQKETEIEAIESLIKTASELVKKFEEQGRDQEAENFKNEIADYQAEREAAKKERRKLSCAIANLKKQLENDVYAKDASTSADCDGDPQNPIQPLDSKIEALNEELAKAMAEYKNAIEEVRTELANPEFILQEPNALLKTLKGNLDYAQEYCKSWTDAKYLKKCDDKKAKLARQIQRHIDTAYSTEATIHEQVGKLLAETNSKLERLSIKSGEHLASCEIALSNF